MHSANAILARSHFEQCPKIVNSYLSDVEVSRKYLLHDMLLDKLEASRFAERKILDYNNHRLYSYSDLARLIRKSATILRNCLNLKQNEYCLFLGGNSIEYVSVYFGAICIGAIPLSLSYQNHNLHDIKTKIIQFNIQHLFVNHASVDQLWIIKLLNSISIIKKIVIFNCKSSESNEYTQSDKIVFVDKLLHQESSDIVPMQNVDLFGTTDTQNDNVNNVDNVNINHNKVCLVVNSSGTSGWPPKQLLYGHQSLVYACEILSHPVVLQFRTIDKFLVYGPFEQLENLLMFFIGIFSGCNLVLVPTFEYSTIVDSIQNCNINLAMFSTNTMVKLMNDSNPDTTLANLTKIISFGGKLPRAFCVGFFRRFPGVKSLRHCYLLAESPCPISLMVLNSHDYDSVGYLMPNTKLKVIAEIEPPDHEKSESDNTTTLMQIMVEPNRLGLICVERHREMFAIGYLSSTKELLNFMPQAGATDDKVFFKTNDIGFYDDNGLIYVHGQLSLGPGSITSICGSLKSIELKIEQILLSHQLVEEVCLILNGEPHVWNVMMVPKQNTQIAPEQINQIYQYLNVKLNETFSTGDNASAAASFVQHKIGDIFIKHSLPKTSAGKVIKSLVRIQLQNLINIKHKF